MSEGDIFPSIPSQAEEGSVLEAFIQELINSQNGLRAYITASLGYRGDVPDVLQRTNLALWKNSANYQPGTTFLAWAVTIAKFEILAHCRDKSRDRHVFPEDIASLMLSIANDACPDPTDRQEALQHCLAKLPRRQRDMLQLRYYDGCSMAEIAKKSKQTENAIKCTLVRVRKALQRCIEAQLGSTLR
jgi:RNA polymerase sigma-70 factor, ECF subfamily